MTETITEFAKRVREQAKLLPLFEAETEVDGVFAEVTYVRGGWDVILGSEKAVFPHVAHKWGGALGVPEGTEWRHKLDLGIAECAWTEKV